MLKAHVNWEHGNEKEKDKESDAVNTFKCDECEFMAETEQSLKKQFETCLRVCSPRLSPGLPTDY